MVRGSKIDDAPKARQLDQRDPRCDQQYQHQRHQGPKDPGQGGQFLVNVAIAIDHSGISFPDLIMQHSLEFVIIITF